MKTFIIYNLDTGLPVGIGEAIKSDWARVEVARLTNINSENLFAEEIKNELKPIQKNSRPNHKVETQTYVNKKVREQMEAIEANRKVMQAAEEYSRNLKKDFTNLSKPSKLFLNWLNESENWNKN